MCVCVFVLFSVLQVALIFNLVYGSFPKSRKLEWFVEFIQKNGVRALLQYMRNFKKNSKEYENQAVC